MLNSNQKRVFSTVSNLLDENEYALISSKRICLNGRIYNKINEQWEEDIDDNEKDDEEKERDFITEILGNKIKG